MNHESEQYLRALRAVPLRQPHRVRGAQSIHQSGHQGNGLQRRDLFSVRYRHQEAGRHQEAISGSGWNLSIKGTFQRHQVVEDGQAQECHQLDTCLYATLLVERVPRRVPGDGTDGRQFVSAPPKKAGPEADVLPHVPTPVWCQVSSLNRADPAGLETFERCRQQRLLA